MFGLQQSGFVSVQLFWIELSMCYYSKSAENVQGLAEKKQKENQRKSKRVRDTSLWKFHHTDGREVGGISPMCPDIGSACYSCLSTLPEGVSVLTILVF